jgi:hypothetical protein
MRNRLRVPLGGAVSELAEARTAGWVTFGLLILLI